MLVQNSSLRTKGWGANTIRHGSVRLVNGHSLSLTNNAVKAKAKMEAKVWVKLARGLQLQRQV